MSSLLNVAYLYLKTIILLLKRSQQKDCVPIPLSTSHVKCIAHVRQQRERRRITYTQFRCHLVPSVRIHDNTHPSLAPFPSFAEPHRLKYFIIYSLRLCLTSFTRKKHFAHFGPVYDGVDGVPRQLAPSTSFGRALHFSCSSSSSSLIIWLPSEHPPPPYTLYPFRCSATTDEK